MTKAEALAMIDRDGPRVLAEYKREYFNGWRAGLLKAAGENPNPAPEPGTLAPVTALFPAVETL